MTFVLMVVVLLAFGVGVVSWFVAAVSMFNVTRHVKPGIEAPGGNKFNHLLFPQNLTEKGLEHRRTFIRAITAFAASWLIGVIGMTLGGG